MIYGYARVSSVEQNLARQIHQLNEAGCEVIFQEKEKGISERPELKKLIQNLNEGDIIIVSDLTRISRSSKDLFELVELIKSNGGCLKSLKDTWLDTTSENPYSAFLLTVMGGVAQLERDLIRQRQAEGVAIAKDQGKYKGRIKKYTKKHAGLSHAIDLYQEGKYTIKKICEITKISRSTLYRELNNINDQKPSCS
ncbi:recombinase family protein [Brevibacillus sp. SYSU BS000544]|uniref:recombinase family protein n=1 Tax=Brevibacillus sp. SYSU BS000544 TaxID=3416443 RepID=UPI003CE538C9